MGDEEIELITRFPRVAHKIGRKLMSGFSCSHDRFNLSPTQRHVLFLIHEGKQLTMTELHGCTGLEKGSLTFVVDQLIEKGFVQRTGDEKDRRKVYVSLTDFGQKETAIHSDEVSRFIQSKLDRLPPDDRAHFFRAIEKLVEISEKLEI
ncbi:MAG: winged helix-turn-helix transcriptional regulator [Deltaproteobacteria bacterium]|nr:winged helix-turn-helix transcriptional regulator [Deltaproteobacteria bacterium]